MWFCCRFPRFDDRCPDRSFGFLLVISGHQRQLVHHHPTQIQLHSLVDHAW